MMNAATHKRWSASKPYGQPHRPDDPCAKRAKHAVALFALILICAASTSLLAQGVASRGVNPAQRGKASGLPWNARFTDIAAEAGLTAPIVYGGVASEDYLVEGSSGGVALFDYNGDGWLDLFFVGGTRFETLPPRGAGNRLYRNNRDGTFSDVTAQAGLAFTGWGSGVAIGDYDNDGHLDLFVTTWGHNLLYRNNGDGTFTERAASAGLASKTTSGHTHWGAGATFVDYDRDGDVDLFVSNYAVFDLDRVPKPGVNRFCNWKGVAVPCGPRGLPTDRPYLYRNESDGTFVDVSQQAGIASADNCFGMTAVAADLDGDGWQDIYVACDSTPALFFHNQRDGTFLEEGLERAVALSDDGEEQAGMGIAVGDYNLDGWLDLFKTHFSDDTHALYRNMGTGSFQEVTLPAGLGVETRYTGWGTGMPDLDNDGIPDLFLVTGNVFAGLEKELPAYPYRTPRLLFRGLDGGKFEQIFEQAGPAFQQNHSSRGAAYGDIDNDGDHDIVVWNRNEPPSLLRNDLSSGNQWIQLRLEGAKSNRAALGAQVTATYGDRKQTQTVLSQSSFYSANDLRLHFGLGNQNTVQIEVRWPSGEKQMFTDVAAGRVVQIREGGELTPLAETDGSQ
jgi:hypothetical protein